MQTKQFDSHFANSGKEISRIAEKKGNAITGGVTLAWVKKSNANLWVKAFASGMAEVFYSSSKIINAVCPPPCVTLTKDEAESRAKPPSTLPRNKNGSKSTNKFCIVTVLS